MQDHDLKALRLIHVAGTNGKGSVCAAVAGLLAMKPPGAAGTRKIGLYTSPHVVNIRERIMLQGQPISEELFARRFFEIWTKLPREPTEMLDIPRYLQLMFLLAVHVFIKDRVDVAVLECHMGGTYDATNIIRDPMVTAITSISLDHVELLGPTTREIAMHKAGIFKASATAFSAPQDFEVQCILRTWALRCGVELAVVEPDRQCFQHAETPLSPIEVVNYSLAYQVYASWMERSGHATGPALNAEAITRAVNSIRLPGRCARREELHCTWYIDGAHNESGLLESSRWFQSSSESRRGAGPTVTWVIYAHRSRQDGDTLLKTMLRALRSAAIEVCGMIITSYRVRVAQAGELFESRHAEHQLMVN